MRIKKDTAEEKFSDCIRNIESELAQISSSFSLRIIEDTHSLGGICILSPELEVKKREAIEEGIKQCEGILVERSGANKSFSAKISLLPKRKGEKEAQTKLEKECGYEYFRENLTFIAHQASMTRIPFSLLLFQTEHLLSRQDRSTLVRKIQGGLNREEIFSVHDIPTRTDTEEVDIRFAVIMPSAGLSKARKRSEEIRQVVQVCTGTAEKKIGLSIGIGVSYAGEGVSEQDFLAFVEKSLEDAVALGDCTRWGKGPRSANSCQVTAEERAQLFGFVK